ncbi:ferredoxin--NADP reductase [Paraliobacillus ryukyuensis]|uniref:Thioredoxin reductase (NADPH) n=1 Tax=Paraliobacillus ryukyuensis TaxID=200904 RepID=A0A366EGI1_9BACI|nr:YpdA family putative bacillithiol disulfide reductase [Paraliobacillus ryukyuensis]RBP01512.1 thioredoxin reductase (NADPH) [Paraliobacillus ryukyuensis]
MQKEQVIIVGAGPCGMSAALALQDQGINPLIIEKENITNSIYHYPTHQTFFSSSNRLEIGDIPFVTERKKPIRSEALAYYREVAKRRSLRVNSFEQVVDIKKEKDHFMVYTKTIKGLSRVYQAAFVIIATGYYDQPRQLEVKGEELPHVFHYFKEAHPFYREKVVIIGGKNSAVDAALELHKANADITVLYRGETYSKSVKPWILPEFTALINKQEIEMEFNATIKEITTDQVIYQVGDTKKTVDTAFVFAMTGYQPDHRFLQEIGVEIEKETGRPVFNSMTLETNVEGIYIAGVIAAGYNNNEIFIENGREHGPKIAKDIYQKVTNR